MGRPISYDTARKHAKQLAAIRKLVKDVDLSFITGERHGKLVELVEEVRRVLDNRKDGKISLYR